jgi:hypothetical protein
MWLNICLILKLWAFILAVRVKHNWSRFLHFPVPSQLVSMSDANWGPQDASLPTSPVELPLFTSRLMSAFYIDLFGPLHWV